MADYTSRNAEEAAAKAAWLGADSQRTQLTLLERADDEGYEGRGGVLRRDVEVSDLNASSAKAKSLGAKVLVGPQTIPDGASFAVLQDPQKATFAMYQPKR